MYIPDDSDWHTEPTLPESCEFCNEVVGEHGITNVKGYKFCVDCGDSRAYCPGCEQVHDVSEFHADNGLYGHPDWLTCDHCGERECLTLEDM